MLKRPHYIAICLVIAMALLILDLPAPASQRLKLTVGGIFLPLFGLAGTSAQIAGEAAGALQTKSSLLARNRELEREISQLRLESMQATEAARENARLRQLVGWQQQSPWKLKLARVVLRDPANWWRTIHIDLGSRHGVRTNMTVLSTEGLVGRVMEVSLERSQVALVGDTSCRVSALAGNDARDTGIIGASGPVNERIATMSYLSRNAELKPGQKVETSGLGGVFPKGIPIGQVVDAQLVEYGLYTQARVRLAANMGSLEEVWVLFP